MNRLPTVLVYSLAALFLAIASSCSAAGMRRGVAPVAWGTGTGALIALFVPGVGLVIAVPVAAITSHVVGDLGAAEETRKDIKRLADDKKASVPWYLDGWAILKALCGWTVLVLVLSWLARRWEWFRPVATGVSLGLNHAVAALRRKLPFTKRGPVVVGEHPQ